MRGAQHFLLALCVLGLCSCVSARWSRELRDGELAAERIARLEVGRTELGESLALLGAPLYVWELPEGAFALAYAWGKARGLGATVRLPGARAVSPSYRYDQGDANLHCAVLLFDRDAVLEIVRTGYLREIAPELFRRRPADLEEGAQDPPSAPPATS